MTAKPGDPARIADSAGVLAEDGLARRPSSRLVDWLDPPDDFNFRHFRMRHMVAELLRTVPRDGVLVGREAPDFELESTHGERLRLRDLRGQPALLHLVSYT